MYTSEYMCKYAYNEWIHYLRPDVLRVYTYLYYDKYCACK